MKSCENCYWSGECKKEETKADNCQSYVYDDPRSYYNGNRDKRTIYESGPTIYG